MVISDVVMPGKTGYELCRQIKENIQLSHIPVILLTAKATVEDQVEGLGSGADAYVTKPFEPQYLIALIDSQLKNREDPFDARRVDSSRESRGERTLASGQRIHDRTLSAHGERALELRARRVKDDRAPAYLAHEVLLQGQGTYR